MISCVSSSQLADSGSVQHPVGTRCVICPVTQSKPGSRACTNWLKVSKWVVSIGLLTCNSVLMLRAQSIISLEGNFDGWSGSLDVQVSGPGCPESWQVLVTLGIDDDTGRRTPDCTSKCIVPASPLMPIKKDKMTIIGRLAELYERLS